MNYFGSRRSEDLISQAVAARIEARVQAVKSGWVQLTLKKYCRSKKDGTSIEISAWDYEKRGGGSDWGNTQAGPLPMVNEDDAWEFILVCQR